jgi:APA family basic amino acid/polyamine antiporter
MSNYIFKRALTYAKLSGAYPRAGGAQNFADKAFGPLHSFMAGWARA